MSQVTVERTANGAVTTYTFPMKRLFVNLVEAEVVSQPGEPLYGMAAWYYFEERERVLPITHTHQRYFNYAAAGR